MTGSFILAEDGTLMDGGHRVAKAWLLGNRSVAAVQFIENPEPDVVLPLGYAYAEWRRKQQ